MKIALVAGFVFSAFIGSAAYSACDPSKVLEIEIKNMKFVPAETEVCVGQTVRWTNTEPVGVRPINHTVTADPAFAKDQTHVLLPVGVDPFNSKSIKQGASWEYTFTVEGDYKYFCIPHEMMGHLGTLKVVKDLTPVPTGATQDIIEE